MKKILFFIFSIIICFTVAWASSQDNLRVQFSKLDTHLWIPKEFISKQSYSWIDGSDGLDSKKNSIRLRFQLFQDLNVFAVLTVLDDKEREDIRKLSQREVEERLGKQGRFSNALIESQKNGVDKVFLTSSIKSKWSLIKNGSEPKWLGECSIQKMTGKTVCVSSWLYDEFLLEITAEDRYIEDFDEITGDIERTIEQWRVKPN